MKTLFVCFLIKIAGIVCYVREVKYPYSEILKQDVVYNLRSKVPEVTAKYIISRNDTTLSGNRDNIKNSANVKEMSSTDNINKIKRMKSMPYKYIEVIHYVPIKVTTSSGGEKVILDTNSTLDNMQKVIVNEDGLSDLQNIIVNNGDLDKVQKTIANEKNQKNNGLDNMQKVTVNNDSGRRNLQKIVDYIDGPSNMRKTIINNVLNIDKEALLNSLGFFVRHPPKGDYNKSRIIFKILLRNFINYLVDRGISDLEILEYLRRQRENTDKGFEVLFNNENLNDYTKVIHFNDNMHNNVKNEGIMRAIEKQALFNSYNYFVHNPPKGEDLFAFKNKEIYILILRDFVKYLIQKGVTDLEIMEYIQQAQKVETRDGTKEAFQQSINNNNQELNLNTNNEVRKDVTLNENLNANESAALQGNPEKYELFNNDSTILIQNLHDSLEEQELKSNLSNYVRIPETSEATADTSKSEDSHIVNINSYRISKEDNKLKPIKYIIENLHGNMPLDHNTTLDRVIALTTNLTTIKNEGNGQDNKSDLSIATDKEAIKKGKVERVDLVKSTDDISIKIIKDIVDRNKTNVSTPLRSLSDLNMSNDNLVANNETIKNKNLSLEVGVMLNGDPENDKTIIVPYTTKGMLNIQIEKPYNLDTVHKYKSNEDIKMKDNIDVIDLWTSEKPNLTSIFHIESQKLNNLDTKTDNKENEYKDTHMLKDNIDFIDLWTSQKPNLKNIFDINSPKLNNVDVNNDGDIKNTEPNYNTDYVSKIEPPRDTFINEIIKLRELVSELVVVLKFLLKEFNPNNIRFYNNIINELLKNELVNRHKLNINANLDIETNDILLENLKFLNIMVPLLIHSNCNWNNDLDIQKIISKYLQLNNLNDLSFTNNDLKEKILFLIKLLQSKSWGRTQEQMTKIIKLLLINPLSSVTNNTMGRYNNIYLNNFVHNLQQTLYKSLLSIVF